MEVETVHGKKFFCAEEEIVIVLYTNWRGITSWRRIVPCDRYNSGEINEFISTEHHVQKQHIMHCFDLDKKDYRSFAMQDIHCWLPEEKAQQLGDGALESLKVNILFHVNWLVKGKVK